MESDNPSSFLNLSRDRMLVINALCNSFEQGLSTGQDPRIEDFLLDLDSKERTIAIHEMLPIEIEHRATTAQEIDANSYRQRFPQIDPDWLSTLISEAQSTSETPTNPGASMDQAPKRLGDYDIIAPLGHGGMGVVYRAIHRRMQRTVALKVLRSDLADNEQLKRRFEREVRAAAKLTHPNIVTAYDAGEHDGCLYLITEFFDAIDLNQFVRTKGAVPVATAFKYILDAAKGLAYAHSQDVIHRDIKPANILVDQSGTLKILDMGLARMKFDDDPDGQHSELTKSGTFMGTAAYMAPEQARNTRHADQRSDVYSLGCVLHYLLSGRPPFQGETMIDTILAHATVPAPSLSKLQAGAAAPDVIDRVFQKMVQKNPDDRYQSMDQLLADLHSLESEFGDSVHAPENIRATAVQDTNISDASLAPTIALPNGPHGNDKRETITKAAKLDDTLQAGATTRGKRTAKQKGIAIVAGALMAIAAIAVYGLLPDQQQKSTGVQTSISGSAPLPLDSTNYGLRFNGQSSFVQIAKMSHNADRPLTIEVILRTEQFRVSNAISWMGPDWTAIFVSENNNWGIGRHFIGNSQFAVANNSTPLNTWIHLAGTWDGQHLRLFIDGQLAATHGIKFSLPPTQPGLFAGGFDPTWVTADQDDRFFAGTIDAIRITDGVRYHEAFPVPDKLKNEAATIALYQFNEGQGTSIFDESDHANHGRIVNAQWVEIPKRP